jgi:hypothetical protein
MKQPNLQTPRDENVQINESEIRDQLDATSPEPKDNVNTTAPLIPIGTFVIYMIREYSSFYF